MSKQCVITGKTTQVARHRSNRIRATQYNPTTTYRRKANLHKKKIFVPELNKTLTVTVSTKGLKTIQKKGAYKALKDAGVI